MFQDLRLESLPEWTGTVKNIEVKTKDREDKLMPLSNIQAAVLIQRAFRCVDPQQALYRF